MNYSTMVQPTAGDSQVKDFSLKEPTNICLVSMFIPKGSPVSFPDVLLEPKHLYEFCPKVFYLNIKGEQNTWCSTSKYYIFDQKI